MDNYSLLYTRITILTQPTFMVWLFYLYGQEILTQRLVFCYTKLNICAHLYK